MGDRMYRAQILLDPRQRRKLEELSAREGKSISAITREVIDAGLDALESEADSWKRRVSVLSAIREARDRQPSVYNGDLISEVRSEREQETDRTWRSGT